MPKTNQRLMRIFTKYPGKPTQRDVPKPIKLFHILGPGVILLATALGSGEIYFWPGITMKYGFILIWPAMLALFIQYILNTEFARYTINTGETVVTGFIRLWKPLGYVFLVGATLPWIWPGWSMGGASAVSWLTGIEAVPIAIVSLLLIGLILTIAKKSYSNLELVEKILVLVVVIFFVLLAVLFIKKESVAEMFTHIVTFKVQVPKDLEISTLLAALAFCGAGGTLNLTTSNWIREKRLGMAAHVDQQSSSFNYEMNESNTERMKQWWRLIKREQFFSFFTIGLIGLIMLMLLSHSLVFGMDYPIGMEFIKAEGQVIGEQLSATFRVIFYVMVAAVFFSTALGVIDHIARLSSDILHTYVRKLRVELIYYLVLWFVIVFGILVLTVLDIDQPPTLLAIAGSLSGIFMFLYSVGILILSITLERQSPMINTSHYNPFRVGIFRKVFIVISILFYGWFSFVLIGDLILVN